MQFVRIFPLLCLFAHASCSDEIASTKNVKKIEATVSVSNVPLINLTEDTKSKNEKRQSTDQLGNFQFAKNNDEPFRPMLPPNYRTETPTSAYQHTTFLSAATATPQVYYDNAPFKYSAQLNEPPRTSGDFTYGSQRYEGPFNFGPQQATQESQQQSVTEVASTKQVEAYVEDQHAFMPPSYYQQQIAHTPPPPQPQQQFQYIIAIPLSYVRRLQQQLAGGQHQQQQQPQQYEQYIRPISPQQHQPHPHPEQSPTLGKHAQLGGPLARDHQGTYRPYQVPSVATPDVQYVTRYIQVPINSPLLHQKPQQMQIAYPPAQAYFHNQQQQQQQQQQPQVSLYSYPQINQPQPQSSAQHPHPQQQQQQQHQQQVRYETKKPQKPEAPSARFSGTSSKSNTKQAPPHAAKPAVPSYSNVYVTPSPAHQQYHPLNYVRFVQPPTGAPPSPAPYSLPPFFRLPIAPSTTSSQGVPLQPLQHYYAMPPQHARPFVFPMQSPVPGHVYPPQDGGLPYFNHPAGVHYGTHLYHPQALLQNSPAPPAPTPAHEATGGNQQRHQQQQQTLYVKHPAGNGYSKGMPSTATTALPPAEGSQNIVKYP